MMGDEGMRGRVLVGSTGEVRKVLRGDAGNEANIECDGRRGRGK
jgi:hypothetical protein